MNRKQVNDKFILFFVGFLLWLTKGQWFFFLVLAVAGFYGLGWWKKKNSIYYFTMGNIIYSAIVFYFLFKGENMGQLLLLMPILSATWRENFREACFWAGWGTVGLGLISGLQHFASGVTDLFLIGLFWLAVFLPGKTEKANQEALPEKESILTNIHYGSSFHYYFEQYFREAQAQGRKLALMLCEVEFFKYYTEAYGYQQGDQVLKTIAAIILQIVGEKACCLRYGRYEFVVFLHDYGGGEAFQLGEKIRKGVAAAQIEGMEMLPGGHFTISVGTACFPEQAVTQEKLLQKADEALYQNKYKNSSSVGLYYSVIDEIGRTLQGQEKKLLNSLRTLLMVVNAKDKYTYGHSERVMHYAVQTGRQLALWEWEVQNLTIGGFLHDIGKIEISREILNKPARLSREEWEIIQHHCIWGADILRPLSLFKGAVDIVLYHHENYDGTGYPTGIAGEAIPLGSRILRVVDSFDAMTSNRPYKKVKTFKEALADLEQYKGVHYDPDIVDAFTNYIQKTGILKEEIVL